MMCEFVPSLVFLFCMFGFLVLRIFHKWITYNSTMSQKAPSLLIGQYAMSLGLKGGQALLMSPPCLESRGCHLIPSFYLLCCYSAQSCCSFCLLLFSAYGPVSCLLSRNIFKLLIRDNAFLCVSLVLRFFFKWLGDENQSVICGTGISWLCMQREREIYNN